MAASSQLAYSRDTGALMGDISSETPGEGAGIWRRRLTIRTTLYAGFGLVFALWLVSGFELVRRLALVEQRTGAVSHRAAAADEQLSRVRMHVLVASVYLRDALFDVVPRGDGYYRTELEKARQGIRQALSSYVPVADLPEERQSFHELEAEVDAFWDTVLPVLEWDETRRATEVRRLLRQEIIPKREIIARISQRIQDLNRVAVSQEQAQLHAIYAGMRRQVEVASGLALVAGMVVAFLVTRRAGALERQIRRQMERNAQNTRDLQRLSARLVTIQEEERRSIARELHDEIGQALTAIKVELSVAGKHAALTEREDAALREAKGLTDRALQQVRDLSQMLHPAMLDDLGLPETATWYLNAFSARTGIPTELVQDTTDGRLAGEIETCLYRIVQEALTNVARHAGATQCRVLLQRRPASVILTVEDDGCGFDPSGLQRGAENRGLGLVGIQERVSGLRGHIQIDTAPGAGTRLTVELPALLRLSQETGGVRPDVAFQE
jgi:signal transduction histidine kinase